MAKAKDGSHRWRKTSSLFPPTTDVLISKLHLGIVFVIAILDLLVLAVLLVVFARVNPFLQCCVWSTLASFNRRGFLLILNDPAGKSVLFHPHFNIYLRAKQNLWVSI